MTLSLLPGIREKIYMGGWSFDKSPSVVEPSSDNAFTKLRLASGRLRVDYAALWDGCCGKITKRTWTLHFSNVTTDDDLRHLGMMGSAPVQMDFCPWTPEFEYFADLTGAVSSRRNATDVIAVVPAGAWTAAFVEADDTQHAVSWGVPDSTSPWRQSFASSNAPGWLIYFPVYRVIVDTPKVTYGPNILEQYSINVEEV